MRAVITMIDGINEIKNISMKKAYERKCNPLILDKMQAAELGQEPNYLLISPLDRSPQDLDLLGMSQGDAFHATRVPGQPLPSPEDSPFLFAGPGSYFSDFQNKQGIIITFEMEESSHIISKSLENIANHPDLSGIPIIGLEVDYDKGRASLIAHGHGRSYESETNLLSCLTQPNQIDEKTLSILCSDSRVRPPNTPEGMSMSIQSLGGFIPSYSSESAEAHQLDLFLHDWTEKHRDSLRILIIAHGAFEGEGTHCGAAQSSLEHVSSDNTYLNQVLTKINVDVNSSRTEIDSTPEERAISMANTTKTNLMTYPSIQRMINQGLDITEAVQILIMDTVTNVLSEFEEAN